MTHLLSKAI